MRHLAKGKSQISLRLQYRVEQQAISKIIPETCKAIYDALAAKYVNTPSSQEYWLAISQQFEDRWNLSHIVGALNNKHIQILLYFTIINAFSACMVLLAVCDAKYYTSLCLTRASTVATTTAACYSAVKRAKSCSGLAKYSLWNYTQWMRI